MTNRVLRRLSRFFEGTGSVLSTPSGDARGHVRDYPRSQREMADLYGSDAFFGRR